MNWWQAVLLGLIQGIAEFLPISSSGHLVLGQYFMGLESAGDVTFEVFTHFGTVLSIITVYRQRIGRILREAFTFRNFRERYEHNDEYRFVVFILITIVPTGIAYVLFQDQITGAFERPRLTCGMLVVTGVLLLLTLLRRNPEGRLSPLKSFVVGCAQAFAMLPGISRSGSTICTALYQGVENRKAADFSFLMSVPIILGAALIDGYDVYQQGLTANLVPLIVGTLTAYVSGIFAINAMVDLVSRGNLHYFAFYLFIVGGLGLLFI
jgi:undecaprenyl-diphosphatase